VFDAVLIIMIGSVGARTLTGGAPFGPGLAAIIVLVALHWLFSGMSRRSKVFSNLIKGTPTKIIFGGKVDQKALADAHMSDDDLAEDLRHQGVEKAAQVEIAYLERSGKLSVIKK
jgi:uncharacterized membrane protein YcaP (DUF421 family)